MGFGMKPGGSDDKLWMESLPGGSEKPTIIHNNPTCSRVPSALWGPCGTGGGDRELPSALVCAGLCTGLDGGVSRTLGELQHPVVSQGCPALFAALQGWAPAACRGHGNIHHHFQPLAVGTQEVFPA